MSAQSLTVAVTCQQCERMLDILAEDNTAKASMDRLASSECSYDRQLASRTGLPRRQLHRGR